MDNFENSVKINDADFEHAVCERQLIVLRVSVTNCAR